MIHEVGIDLGTELATRGCPIPVVDGPELRPTTTYARERIVIEHDPVGDSYALLASARHRADINPRTWMTRLTGVRVTIYAQNPNKGSIYWEHIRRAEKILDMVLVCLNVVAKKRQNLISFKSGKFVYPEELQKGETMGGAVYELLFTFDRGVADRNWDDSDLPTAAVSQIKSVTNVLIQGEDPHAVETACGGS